MVEQVAAAQAAATYADARVQAVTRYASPQLNGATTPSTVQQSLQELVDGTAAEQAGLVARQRRALAQVTAVPWHAGVRAARRRCLTYVDRRLQLLQAEGSRLPGPDPAGAGTAAAEALLAAGADPAAVRAALAG